jgi:UPF0716 protein FxsA
MLSRLLLLFIVVPLIELALLLQLAKRTSPILTLTLVIATGALGAILARQQGVRVLLQIRRQLNAGRLPTRALLDALMIFVAGALLVTPGILTDLFGFSLLIPACRRRYRTWLAKRFQSSVTLHVRGNRGARNDPDSMVLDGTAKPVEESGPEVE